MDATTVSPRPWNYLSEVRVCATCDGLGVVPAHRAPSINDPYPEQPCPDCSGPHEPECEVCGYTQQVTGYDCICCYVIGELSDSELKTFAPMEFAAALINAMQARRAA